MKSKLSKTAYFYSILILIFPIVMFFLMLKFHNLMEGYEHWGITVFFVFCGLISIFVVIWGIFVEMNLRMSRITVSEKQIEVQRFLGIGKTRVWNTEEIDGFITKGFKTRGGYQEYCYLIQNNIAIAVFSSMYYTNYNDIRSEIQKYIKQLG